MVAFIIVAVVLIAYGFMGMNKNVNSQSSSFSTSSNSSTNLSSTGLTVLTSESSSVSLNVSGCGSVVQNLSISESQTGHICLKIYYYSQNGTVTIHPSDLITIYAPPFNNSVQNMFFTISSSQNTIVIGGPQQLNEGVTTDIAIHAGKGSSGSYAIYVAGHYPYGCTTIRLIVGDGQPDYLLRNSYDCGAIITSVTVQGEVTAYALAPNK